MDKIEEKHLEGPPKKIGMHGKKPVFLQKTKGGLYMVTKPKAGGFEMLGSGPHRAVARIVAERNVKPGDEEIVWTELSKSDHVPAENYALILPDYIELTDKLRELNGDK